jgi:predicted Zn-dependent protease
MKDLPLPDHRHLEAAEGWLGLGSWREASDELGQIQPQFRAHPSVLEMGYKIHAEAKHWELALAVAREVSALLPDELWGHFYTAFALHELKRTQAAHDTLIAVAAKYPADYLLRYNLACYACQLGRREAALQWLKQAMALAGKNDLRPSALADRDLEPLWAQIRGSDWEKWCA